MTDKMTHDDMIKWLEDQSITEVECLVSDIAGIPRGKILPVHKFISAASGEGCAFRNMFLANRSPVIIWIVKF